MISDPIIFTIESLLTVWLKGERRVQAILVFAVVLGFASLLVYAAGYLQPALLEKSLAEVLAAAFGGVAAALIFGVIAYQNIIEKDTQRAKIEIVEQSVRDNPDKPQLAWDLARTKLESYLDRNLSQVRSIYWLTLFVMTVGFGFVLYGLYNAFQSPDKLPVTIVASASGVLISFIGGSFLLIYRSILGQSQEYVAVLERINAVGMAVQVISNIPDENSELKNQTTAELAKQLLSLYAKSH